jgi:hypothetical protein
MVVMDAGILLMLFRSGVGVPLDPKTKQPVTDVPLRLNHLVKSLEKSRTKIAIPTPALSELLVRAGPAAMPLLQSIDQAAVFRIVAFDTMAAVEVAAMTKKALDGGDKKGGLQASWNKVEFVRSWRSPRSSRRRRSTATTRTLRNWERPPRSR